MSFGSQKLADLGKAFLADAADEEQVFGTPEQAVLRAKRDDRLGGFAADMRQFLDLIGGCGVDVYGVLGGCVLRSGLVNNA